jgi:hypothetical protein
MVDPILWAGWANLRAGEGKGDKREKEMEERRQTMTKRGKQGEGSIPAPISMPFFHIIQLLLARWLVGSPIGIPRAPPCTTVVTHTVL